MEQKENNKILLHACCAICSAHPIEMLKNSAKSSTQPPACHTHVCQPVAALSNTPLKSFVNETFSGYEVVVYFYNPNIFPCEEYERRLEAEKTLCKHFGVELIEGEYEPQKYFEYVRGYEDCPEKGARCELCFKLRLAETARKARALGIDTFTTSIVISPHKNFATLTKIGEEIAAAEGLNYLAIDFKKKDGFLKTNKISRELGLYRQNYCGCAYSIPPLATL